MISVSGVRKSWLIFVKNFSFISFGEQLLFLLQFCSLLLQSYVVMLFESVYYIGYYTNGKQYV